MKFAVGLSTLAFLFSASSASAAVILYDQNFESPAGFVNDGGDVNIFRTVNQLYSNQPPGFIFTQTNTVETLLVGGTQAWATAQGGTGGFKDPQAIAGNYVLGMLSDAQNDLLGLAFNVGSNDFLNFKLNISSIDLDRWGGPFVPVNGLAPIFRLSLFDNPSGSSGIGSGTLLDSEDITGLVALNKWTFNWSEFIVGLDASASTNGNVIVQLDLLQGGYAAMDNFLIAASDTSGDVGGQVPEPFSLALLGIGLGALVVARRNQQARM